MAKKKGGGGSQPTQTNAGPNPMGKPAPQSMSAQVKTAGSVVSKKEATSIAKDTGKSVAQVMAKAQDKGQALGSGLVNQFNAGKLGANLTAGRGKHLRNCRHCRA
jgi:ABC-type enterochelin transport system substrate-binding protein